MFSTYEHSLHLLNQYREPKDLRSLSLSLPYYFAAGAAGGFTQSLVLCPIDVVKSKLQVMGIGHGHGNLEGVKVPSSLQVAREIVKNRGLLGLYLGLLPTLYRDVIGYGFFFTGYEGLKLWAEGPVATHAVDSGKHEHHGHGASMIAVTVSGGLAGVLYHLSTYPFDVVKSIVQTQTFVGETPKYNGMLHCFETVYREAGLKGFTKGFTPTVLRSIPASATGFLAYELVQQIFSTKQ